MLYLFFFHSFLIDKLNEPIDGIKPEAPFKSYSSQERIKGGGAMVPWSPPFVSPR